MSINCKHAGRPYYDEYYKLSVVPPTEPPTNQIRNMKLYKCSTCGKWYSLIGAVLRAPLIIEEVK